MPRTLVVHAEVRHRHTGEPEGDADWRGFGYDIVESLLRLHGSGVYDVALNFSLFRDAHREPTRDWHGPYFWDLQDMRAPALMICFEPSARERFEAARNRLSIYGMAFVCGFVPNFNELPRYRLTEGKRQRL